VCEPIVPCGRRAWKVLRPATVIWQRLLGSDEPYDLPADEPLTLASYAAGTQVEVYLEHLAVGAVLPEMPLFLHPDR
jgi:hypothetical protein